jgi:hypothetical protein
MFLWFGHEQPLVTGLPEQPAMIAKLVNYINILALMPGGC